MIKKKFNIFKIPLKGINLIEASAGTGKTSAIALLYLRLLLGLEKNKKKFLVQEILVVTFTNAAKEELYTRIKEKIEQLHLSCINKKSADPILILFLKKIKNFNEAISILENAKININNACIYTIHKFCQKVLQHDTFVFNEKIIEDEYFLYLQATQDFWRMFFYNLPKNLTKIVYEEYKNPNILLKEIKSILQISSLITFKKKFKKNETLISFHEKIVNKIDIFKKKWLNYNSKLLHTINKTNINKKIYNKLNITKWQKNITEWSKCETKDYKIPDCLKYFSENKIKKNTKDQNIQTYFFCKEINEILKKDFSLKSIILFYAIKNIPKFIQKEKEKKSLLGFNDLLDILLKNIKKDKNLRNMIIKRYPAALIDEFQDTDLQQYQIFNYLYQNKKTVIFLVGDPKQSIYSFRGSDIFSYLHAKSNIKKHYYLDTNWRSSKNMCKAVNYLFSRNTNPFYFKNIQFIPVLSSSKNLNIKFKIKGKDQTAIHLFFKKQEKISLEDYQHWIAKQCANEISYWLICAKKGEATFLKNNEERILTEKDIVVLVRNKKDAKIIQEALQKVHIISKYSSPYENIFKTDDAHELLSILKSILDPTDINLLKQSMLTHILKKIVIQKKKHPKQKISYLLVEKLYKYNEIWDEIGILYAVKKMILEYQKHSNNFEIYKNQQKNRNFLKIAELLEEKKQNFYEKYSLIRWFEKKISEENSVFENEYVENFEESKIIRIITIHKSKGLQYPIVWIPFGIDFNESKSYFYRNVKNLKIFFDNEKNYKTLKKSDKERLAEDLRFLYVALTRSIYHCSIGIACLKKDRKKIKNQDSDTHKSAVGYIIQRGKYMNYKQLTSELNVLSKKSYIEVKYNTMNLKFPIIQDNLYILSKTQNLLKEVKKSFQITSFTKIKEQNEYLKNNKYENIDAYFYKTKKTKLTIHNFPRGSKTGILIHYILKKIQFNRILKINWLCKILEKYQFSEKWAPVLTSWINNVICFKLNHLNITLSSLKKTEYVKELEFFLPINQTLCDTDINKITQPLDLISSMSPKIYFNSTKGILKGFIDLVFIWNKKYYIVDYKSNFLGDNDNAYSFENIRKEMIKNRYDLQYQLYTVALNQYLKKKIKKYHYKTHFGGVFYIFVRGINIKNSIFYTLPEYLLIKKLTSSFFKKNK